MSVAGGVNGGIDARPMEPVFSYASLSSQLQVPSFFFVDLMFLFSIFSFNAVVVVGDDIMAVPMRTPFSDRLLRISIPLLRAGSISERSLAWSHGWRKRELATYTRVFGRTYESECRPFLSSPAAFPASSTLPRATVVAVNCLDRRV